MSYTYTAIIAIIAALLIVTIYLWIKSRRVKKKAASELYISGLKALLAGDEGRAFQNLREVVRQDTNNVDAYLKLGDLFRKGKQYTKAFQIHRELTLRSRLSGEEKEEILKSLALDYSASGKHQKAISALEELHRRNGEDDWVIDRLLFELEETKMWDKVFEIESRRVKQKGQKESKKLALYKVCIGKELAEKSELHKARVAFKEALNYDENCVPAYLYLGDAYYQDRRLSEAVEHWRKLLDVKPSVGYLVFDKLERVLYELGQYGEITEVYNEILSTNPNEAHTLYALGNILEKKGRSDQAIDYYNQILENDPNFVPAKLNLLKLYEELGLKDKAKRIIDNLIKACHPVREGFICKNCDFVSTEPLWRCPSCKKWDSFDI